MGKNVTLNPCLNILVRGNRSSGKSETDSPEHWKPPNASLLA